MRRVVRRAGALSLVPALVAAFAVSAAAGEPTASGWWWLGRPTSALPGVFTPVADVPEGGLYVAGGASGPTAVSALRFEVDPTATAATLTLVIASATGAIAIEACRAKTPWEPAENGGWDQRPEPDCDAGVVSGAVDSAGSRVTFPLSALSDAGTFDLVLVPAASAGGDASGFEAAFEPPGADALAVEKVEAVEPEPAGPASEPSPPVTSGSAGATDTFDVATPAMPLSPQEPAEPTPAASPRAPETPSRAAAAPRPIAANLLDDGRFAYPVVLGLPLLLLIAAAYFGWAFTQPIVVRGVPRP